MRSPNRYELLAHPRRLQIWNALQKREQDVSVTELVDSLIDGELDDEPGDFHDDHRRNVRTDLVHVHLPKLDDSGVLDWEHSTERVCLCSDPPIDHDRVGDLVESRSIASITERAEILRHERRRTVLAVLAERSEPVTTAELATAVTAAEQEVDVDAVIDADCDRVAVSLHHSHLPRLAETELVEYDRERDIVTDTDSNHSLFEAF